MPFGDEHLAAILTLPESIPRGLVVLLQGAAATPRSARNQAWTIAARRLAAADIASVRMDYPGVGDSTGVPSFEIKAWNREQALKVTRVALDALQVEKFAVVGQCIGVRTALEVGGRVEGCVGAACNLVWPLGPLMEVWSKRRFRDVRRILAQRIPALHRIMRRVMGATRTGQSLRFLPELTQILRSGGHVLFMHGGPEESDRRLRDGAVNLMDEVGSDAGQRLQILPLQAEAPYGTGPLVAQDQAIDAIVAWADKTLPPVPQTAPPPASRPQERQHT